jgi:hypothetical protein
MPEIEKGMTAMPIRIIKTPVLLITALILSANVYASAGWKNTNDYRPALFIGAHNFYWDEHDDNGEKLLDEKGILYELGFKIDNGNRNTSGWLGSLQFSFKRGDVDYDGQTQSGTPVKTTTKYQDYVIEGNAGYRFHSGGMTSFDLLAGLGVNSWDRDIQNSTDINGNPVFGYLEEYRLTYARLTAGINFHQTRWLHQLRAGGRYGLDISERIDLFGVTLEPKPQFSPYIEWRSDRLSATGKPRLGFSIYHEQLILDKSDPVAIPPFLIWQPESKRVETGLRLYYSF